MRMHLLSLDTGGSFIPQERKDGLETNVEVWMQEGEPLFAFMILESKKKYAMDMGELVGWRFRLGVYDSAGLQSGDRLGWHIVPGLLEDAIHRLCRCELIASRDGLWFFEKCERLGYNAHQAW